MKYNIGDKVKIKKDLNKVNNVNVFMEHYKGMVATIRNINKYNKYPYYTLDIDYGNYSWCDEMLEDIDIKIPLTKRDIEYILELCNDNYELYNKLEKHLNMINKGEM